MEVQELKKQKMALEYAIYKMLVEFERATGTSVQKIELTTLDQKCKNEVINVDVTIKL